MSAVTCACLKCGETKPASEFTKNKARKTGLCAYCKTCYRAVQAKWYEKQYGSTHPAKKLRTMSAWERFKRRFVVDESSGCWIWQGGRRGNMGYGAITDRGKPMSAHRAAWIMYNGQIPDGLLVCHKCDNPRCVNPAHLFLGTHQDNMDDRTAKNRQSQGIKHSEAIFKATSQRSANHGI